MHLAIVNDSTGVVENVIVPPQGATAWVVPEGYTAIQTSSGKIGDVWDGIAFSTPEIVQEE